MNAHELTESIKRKALELGYVAAGVTTVADFEGYADLLKDREGYGLFLAQGEESELLRGASPLAKAPEAKSIISLVYSYGHIDFPAELLAYVGRCYLGRAYNPPADIVQGARRELMKDYLHSLGIQTFDERGTFQQLPDRAVAARAGLVTYGRNNFAYAGDYGSFVILTSIPVNAELETVEREAIVDCPPSCHACVEACPTHAMGEDGALVASRCILYNNIFPDSVLFDDVREHMGTRVHGCDACQLACPRNRCALEAPKVKDPLLEQIAAEFSLEKLLFLDDEYYECSVRPIMYNYIRDLDLFRRNAAIAMGNSEDACYLPALRRAASEGSELVRKHARWAIERLEEGAASTADIAAGLVGTGC